GSGGRLGRLGGQSCGGLPQGGAAVAWPAAVRATPALTPSARAATLRRVIRVRRVVRAVIGTAPSLCRGVPCAPHPGRLAPTSQADCHTRNSTAVIWLTVR